MDALRTIKKIFDKKDIFFWLDYGTMLGAVREGKMIPWDWDMDVSIWFKDALKVFCCQPEFQEQGYEIYANGHRYGVRDIKTKEHVACILFKEEMDGFAVQPEIVRPFRQLFWLLMETTYEKHDYTSHSKACDFVPLFIRKAAVHSFTFLSKVMVARMLKRLLLFVRRHHFYVEESTSGYIRDFKSFEKVKFYNDYFNIPSGSNNILSFMYGSGWRIPDKNFVWRNIKLKECV